MMLRELGFDVKAVDEVGLRGCEDAKVVQFAITEDRIIVTLDLGYGATYYFSKKGQVGMIVLRIHPPTVESVNQLLENFFNKVSLEANNLTKCLIILNKNKYRVRR